MYHLLRIPAYVPAQAFEIHGIIWCETSYVIHVVVACVCMYTQLYAETPSSKCVRENQRIPWNPKTEPYHRQLRHWSIRVNINIWLILTYITLTYFNQIDVTVPVFQIAPSLHCRVVHCLPLSPSLLSTKGSS